MNNLEYIKYFEVHPMDKQQLIKLATELLNEEDLSQRSEDLNLLR